MQQNYIYRGETTQTFDLIEDSQSLPSRDDVQESLARMETMIEDMHTIMIMGRTSHVRG